MVTQLTLLGRKAAILFLSKAAAQYTLEHALSKRPAVQTHESLVFLARSPGELAQLQSSSSGIWAFRLQPASKRFITPLPAALTPLSVSGSWSVAFYRLCFNCRVNIWGRCRAGEMEWLLLMWMRGSSGGGKDTEDVRFTLLQSNSFISEFLFCSSVKQQNIQNRPT